MSSLVLFLLLIVYPSSVFLQCSSVDYTALPVSFIEQVNKADLVLHGRDVTPQYSCAQMPENCGRRQIEFEVYCILKGDNSSIADTITIGSSSDSLSDCQRTYFKFGDRDELVVLIKRDGSNYDWDEITYSSVAKFKSSDVDWTVLLDQCTVQNRKPGGGMNDQNVTVGCKEHTLSSPECIEGPVCDGEGWARVGKKCYRASASDNSLSSAGMDCLDQNGELMSVSSTEEFAGLSTALESSSYKGPWLTSGLCSDTQCIWHLKQDFHDCCMNKKVPQKCLPLCSPDGARKHRDLMNDNLCLIALPLVFQCGNGEVSQRPCCKEKIMEDGVRSNLTNSDLLCVEYCDMVDGMKDPLEPLSSPDPTEYEHCGGSFYMNAVSHCWNKRLPYPVIPQDLLLNDPIDEGTVTFSSQGLTVNPVDNADNARYMCQKSPRKVNALTMDPNKPPKPDMKFDSDVAIMVDTKGEYLSGMCCRRVYLSDARKTFDLSKEDTFTIPASYLRQKPQIMINPKVKSNAMYSISIGIPSLMEVTKDDNKSTNFVTGSYMHWIAANISKDDTSGYDVIEWEPIVSDLTTKVQLKVFKQIEDSVTVKSKYFDFYNKMNGKLISCTSKHKPRCVPMFGEDSSLQMIGLQEVAALSKQLEVTVDEYSINQMIVQKIKPSGVMCRKLWPQTKVVDTYAVCDINPSRASDNLLSSTLTLTVVVLIGRFFV